MILDRVDKAGMEIVVSATDTVRGRFEKIAAIAVTATEGRVISVATAYDESGAFVKAMGNDVSIKDMSDCVEGPRIFGKGSGITLLESGVVAAGETGSAVYHDEGNGGDGSTVAGPAWPVHPDRSPPGRSGSQKINGTLSKAPVIPLPLTL
ncbi:MAG: hypothetical protein JMJ93_02560 [Synergistaceae bacterium]|jgi:hypothetical protein|nr:hypothetical protein [Synergistaceae bacterium]